MLQTSPVPALVTAHHRVFAAVAATADKLDPATEKALARALNAIERRLFKAQLRTKGDAIWLAKYLGDNPAVLAHNPRGAAAAFRSLNKFQLHELRTMW
jgi:hypothetical protein